MFIEPVTKNNMLKNIVSKIEQSFWAFSNQVTKNIFEVTTGKSYGCMES